MNYIYLLLGVLFATSLVIAADNELCQISFFLPPGSDSDDSSNDFICANSTSGSDDIDGPVTVTIPAATNRSVFSPPDDESLILTFLAKNIWGSYITNGSTSFVFQISGGSAVGLAAECDISYDFDGDGSWDRTETFDIFPTDNIPDSFESWASANTSTNTTGDYANLIGGSIRVRVWSAFGDGPMHLRIGLKNDSADIETSFISFPFMFQEACCGKIDLIRDELLDLMDRVDILNSKLANLTSNCCGTNSTSTATASGSTSSSSAGTVTSLATVAETATELSTATAIVASTDTATDVGTAVATGTSAGST